MNEYQQTIMRRRTSEAGKLWSEMVASGFTETTVAALEFVFFSNTKKEAQNLVEQLSENYTLEVTPSGDPGYVLIKGTTRPYGHNFTYEQWTDWVEYMVITGFKHNAVFSTWSLISSETTWSSESIETE